jgi:NADPH:quinone reductase-like Zn-dependent oxidoreductase
MKAWIKRNSGLRFDEVPPPNPRSDELLVKVDAVSLNRGELRSVARAAEGVIPGWDVAGTVIAGAPNGKGPAIGTRVVALVAGGGWAELVSVPAAHAAVVPDEIALEVAATLPVAALTVVRGLQVAGSLLGKRMLVTGAAGGVGQFAIQMGKSAGASVTGVSSRRTEWQALHELGASDIVAAVNEAVGPFDFILESAGGQSLALAMERLARGGGLVTIGNSSEEETTFNARTLYGKGGAWIYGLLIFDEMENRRVDGRDLERVISLVQSGRLRTSIALRRDWSELPTALEEFEQRSYAGKAVLTVR